MSLLESLTGRKKRDKFPIAPSNKIDTLTQDTISKGETMGQITYHSGSGRSKKAEYRIGKLSIPASAITRVINGIGSKTGAALDRAFYQGLVKYESVLETLEAAKIQPAEAVKVFQSLKPVKSAGTEGRVTKVKKTADVFAKAIVKRFRGEDPSKLVEEFLAMANNDEFKKEVAEIINKYKADFNVSPTGHIKTSNRKANPKAMKALAAARAKKK